MEHTASPITVQGVELDIPGLAPGEHATNVVVLIRTEQVNEDGSMREYYASASSTTPHAMLVGMARMYVNELELEEADEA